MMRLKTYLLGCIPIILLINCSQPSSTQEAHVDSTHVQSTTPAVVETVAATMPAEEPTEPEEPVEPPIETTALFEANFDFTRGAITDDKREQKILDNLDELITQFNQERFVTLNMTYTHDDPVTGGIVKEETTWYYNAERKLSAANRTYKSDRTTEESHYLLKDDELVAMVLDSDFYDEGAGYSSYVRIASTGCPQLCGVTISNDDGDGNELSEVSSIYEHENDFIDDHNGVRKTLKEVTEITKQGDRYLAFVIFESNVGVDTIKYSVDPNLVNKFFRQGIDKRE